MLEQTVSEFYPILAEKNLTWKVDIPPGIWILCDRDNRLLASPANDTTGIFFKNLNII